MNKEELLDKMRDANCLNDPYEKEVSEFSWKIGSLVAVLLGAVLFCFEWIFFGDYNNGLFIVIVSIFAVKSTIQAIKIKSKESIVYGILYSVIFLMCAVVYIVSFFNGWL